ncbi:hypothetical protein COLO4_33799 [Corchorus olitorius]|uniref:Uncharacterized protein n=1 Tax=Corchorus olitorius TaxID=93759 RepID=A0A1R3GRB3_9ROSI|nr:hypothetical protein COLO4_33799 [Corchorus olitorius]
MPLGFFFFFFAFFLFLACSLIWLRVAVCDSVGACTN